MNVIDLNADVGESYGLMHSGMDSEIIPHVTSVNIATGFHSGDPDTIKKTVELAISNNKSIGAHPSYPDLQGFGRRKIDMDANSIENLINYQVGALHAFSKDKLNHVKPHGALNNMSSLDPAIATAIARGVNLVDPNLWTRRCYSRARGTLGAGFSSLGAKGTKQQDLRTRHSR